MRLSWVSSLKARVRSAAAATSPPAVAPPSRAVCGTNSCSHTGCLHCALHRSGCPFCKNAKALLTDVGADFLALELDTLGQEGKAIRAELAEVSVWGPWLRA